MTRYRLTYFDVRALGEPVRYILAYAGIDFQDLRVKEEWPQIKPKMPFGKLPVLEVDGEMYHQSAAICRYLAVDAGLAGSNPKENLRIDQIVGAFNDLTAEVGRMYNTPEQDLKEKLKKVLVEETMPFYFQRFDRIIADNNGFLANSKLSWADLYVVAYSESLPVIFAPKDPTSGYPRLAEHKTRVHSLPAIERWLRARPESIL